MARKVDDLGRIVLPVELRRLHGIQTGDALEISVDGDSIVLRKLSQGCVFCGTEDGLSSYRARSICVECRDGLTAPAASALSG
ncbi:MAG TPA: AbrB/MazE/SpoVT family DNA-binding domain-containing protein [Acidimicrobiales bacterium]|nr:AbrB/MazE/SpoVT family DNA-binding domain-containing protein [Acidimicrobiales bacterium]